MIRMLLCLQVAFSVAHAAEVAQTFDRARRRAGVWAGLGALRATLALDAPSASVSTQVDALPVVGLGLEWWPNEATGLFISGAFGLGATLEIPSLGVSLNYNAHQLEAGARYRWFLGPRGDAIAVFAGLGVRGTRQTAQVQRPSLLVDSVVFGPTLTAGLEWPLAGERLWLRAESSLGLPFFVREAPDDSGDPVRFLALGARLSAVLGLAPRWGLQLSLDLADQRLGFEGEGTRAASVFDAETHDRFVTALLAVRHAL